MTAQQGWKAVAAVITHSVNVPLKAQCPAWDMALQGLPKFQAPEASLDGTP